MTQKLLATYCIALGFVSVSWAQSKTTSEDSTGHYNRTELRQAVLSAHSPEQFKTLANYYRTRHDNYMKQAAEEKKEWERRNQNVTGVLAKYPRPVDSARNLYEYYMTKAEEAGELEAKYSNLAGSGAPVKAE